MRRVQYLLIIILAIIVGVVVIHAQSTDCNIDDAEKVIRVVQNVCEGLGDNQVCYGNYEVGADLLDNLNLPDFTFKTPGDIADVENIKSLYLSALNPQENTWGIAQMRLLTPTVHGKQELNLLLFGDVSVQNSTEPTKTIDIQVTAQSANIRNLPSVDTYVLDSVVNGAVLQAVGRLKDSSWIRVKTENYTVGWVLAELVAPVNEGDNIKDLEIQDNSSPYFGPMQAFVFEQGVGSACGNLTSDGLLIQTPQGPATVSVSINGVNISLTPGKNGAAAVLQDSSAGLNIGMVTGYGTVNSGGVSQVMGPGAQLTVGSSGAISMPTTYDTSNLGIPGLSLMTTIEATTTPSSDTASSTSVTSTDMTATPDASILGTTSSGSTGGTGGTGGGTNTTCNANQQHSNPNACNK